jgi:hypothetical protein
MAEGFTIDVFAPHAGSKFMMNGRDSQAVELELESVTDLGSSARHIQFSLIFIGPQEAPIEQRIYRLDHPALGSLELFLVPIGRDQKGVQYQAVFNRNVE